MSCTYPMLWCSCINFVCTAILPYTHYITILEYMYFTVVLVNGVNSWYVNIRRGGGGIDFTHIPTTAQYSLPTMRLSPKATYTNSKAH